MKRIILITALFSLSFYGNAQIFTEDIAIGQSLFTKSKKLLISNYFGIDNSPKYTAFWKLYDDYESKRRAASLDRYQLIQEYSAKYETLDNATAACMAQKFIDNSTKVNRLNRRYYKKFKHLVGGIQAATLFQIELYIQTAVQMNFQGRIPIIGELQKMNETNNF